MYQVSQLVVYGSHGVCRIIQMEERVVDRKPVSYYVLEPVAQPGTRFLIPSHNPAALAKIRPLLEKSHLLAILTNPSQQQCWVQDENRRKQLYRQIITSGDALALIGMLRLLEIHRLEKEETGRKIHQCDENFLRDAHKVLEGEISAVLGIPEKDVQSYLHQHLQVK